MHVPPAFGAARPRHSRIIVVVDTGAKALDVNLVVRPGPLRLRVIDGSDGPESLPGLVPRPPGVSVLGSHSSDLALVARTVTL